MKRRDFLSGAAAGLAAACLRPTGAAAALPPGVTRIAAPRDAAALAAADCATVPAKSRPYSFYVWDHRRTPESVGAISWAVNATLCQSSRIVLPTIIQPDGGPRLLRWDLYELCPRTVDFDRLWGVLQSLADHNWLFMQPSATGKQTKVVRRRVAPYVASDGRTYDYVAETITEHNRYEFSIGAGGDGSLQILSDLAGGNRLPLCRGDWLTAVALTSIDVEGIPGEKLGYYALAGIKAGSGRQTDVDAFIEQFGGTPKPDAFRLQRSAQKGFTGLSRRIEAQVAVSGRPIDGFGMITRTLDADDKNRDPNANAVLNLDDDLAFNGQELIATRPNGLFAFLIADGKGKRVAVVPDTIASWALPESSAPWNRKHLIAGASCIGCHGMHAGLRQTVNVVRDNDRAGFSPLLQLKPGSKLPVLVDTVEVRRSQYLDELEPALDLSRLSYTRAVDKATFGAFRAKEGERDSIYGLVDRASKYLVHDFYAGYFRQRTAADVLRDAGYECDPKLAHAALQVMLGTEDDDDARLRTLFTGRNAIGVADEQDVFFEVLKRDRFRRLLPASP